MEISYSAIRDMTVFGIITVCASILSACVSNAPSQRVDIVIKNGLVMDPESGLSAVRNVGINHGKIVEITEHRIIGSRVIDAKFRVVAPGFIDLHSHAHNTQLGGRIQAFDGVTTAIEAEMGQLPISLAYSQAAAEGRSINYGYSASWLLARMAVMTELQPNGTLQRALDGLSSAGWANVEATPTQVQQITAKLDKGLRDGGLGIGFLLGYAPATNQEEVRQLSLLAARHNVPVFVHKRSDVSDEEGIREIIDEAIETEAQWHVCHAPVNNRLWLQSELSSANHAGAMITTETIVLAGGSTFISAEFLRPESLQRAGRPASIIRYYGRPVSSYEELEQLQKDDPAAFVFVGDIHADEKDYGLRDQIAESVKLPGWSIVSDAMPWTDFSGQVLPADIWPLPKEAWAHPRSAGNYAHTIEKYVIEWKLLNLMDVLRAGSLNSAKILERTVPQMRNKGRIKVGADADIIIFDPSAVRMTATADKPASLSEGMDYVVVNGQLLIDNGELDTKIFPGRAVRREPTN